MFSKNYHEDEKEKNEEAEKNKKNYLLNNDQRYNQCHVFSR